VIVQVIAQVMEILEKVSQKFISLYFVLFLFELVLLVRNKQKLIIFYSQKENNQAIGKDRCSKEN